MSTNSIGSGAQARSEIGRPRLLQRVHEGIRLRHNSRRTEEACVHWIKRLIYFHGKRHPSRMGPRSTPPPAAVPGIYAAACPR